jgi:hypothetical protein
LQPHPAYQALSAPIAASRARRVALQQRGPIQEPLITTSTGIILDGHARWRVAQDRQQPTLPCLEYDVTEDEALQIVIRQHRAAEGLNAYCRIVLALELEPFLKERSQQSRLPTSTKRPSSNLTNESRDVRKVLASAAVVSAGNVTKVKQLVRTVVPEVRVELVRGEVSIHRAWQWHSLSPEAQRTALWEHLHQGTIKTTITRLIRSHADAGAPEPAPPVPATILAGLARLDANGLTVAVIDVPGRAVVMTRACYNELQETGQ